MSAANAKTALGATFKAVASGGSVAAIAEMLKIDPPKLTRGVIEASDLATTGGKEYIHEGLYDIGEVSGMAHWILGSTADDLFLSGIQTGGLYDFELVAKAATGTEDMNWSGLFTEFGGDTLEIDGKQTCSFTAKGSGDYTQAASA